MIYSYYSLKLQKIRRNSLQTSSKCYPLPNTGCAPSFMTGWQKKSKSNKTLILTNQIRFSITISRFIWTKIIQDILKISLKSSHYYFKNTAVQITCSVFFQNFAEKWTVTYIFQHQMTSNFHVIPMSFCGAQYTAFLKIRKNI